MRGEDGGWSGEGWRQGGGVRDEDGVWGLEGGGAAILGLAIRSPLRRGPLLKQTGVSKNNFN